MTRPNHHSREEVAKVEIGHTDSTLAKNAFLTAFFVAVIAAVPLLQNFREFHRIQAGYDAGRRFPQSWDALSLLIPDRNELQAIASGRLGALEAVFTINRRVLRDSKTYETELKDRDAIMRWVIPRMQIPLTAWLKGGNEDTYCGRDGWLFYRRDVDSLTGPGFLEPEGQQRRVAFDSGVSAPPHFDPLEAIVDFRNQLSQRGIALIVVPVPVKPSIYPESLSARYSRRGGAVQNPSFAEFTRRLAAANVSLFDPTPFLLQAKAIAPDHPLYLKTDTHWTPQGMELIARALAGFARDAIDLPPATSRYLTVETTVQNAGDLAMMLSLPADATIFAPETVLLRQVTEGTHLWRPDPKAEILVLGDSFANIYSLESMGWGESAGFLEHLSASLGLPVDAITRNDAGSLATREMLARELRRGHDRLMHKKLVIWEFAARELAFGDWRPLPLDLGEPSPAGMYVPASGQTVEIRGVVRAVAPAPRPGSVPYKDHIVMVHLAELQAADDPAAAGKEAVVFVRSLRDNVPTSASRYRVGDMVHLYVQPWADVARLYEAINRTELEDDALLLAEPGWGSERPESTAPQTPAR